MHIIIFDYPSYYIALIINKLNSIFAMEKVVYQMRLIEVKFLKWTEANSYLLLRINIGVIYVLYGVLKFFPNYSPAEQLAADTIEKLSFGLFSGTPALVTLATIETLIGLSFILRYQLKWAIYLAIAHMAGTFLPLFFFPEQTFSFSPVSFSLAGQYIIKNLVIVSSLLVLYIKSAKRSIQK